MSKNAFVLDDHFGDNGYCTAGRILRDVEPVRFKHLEKRGLVREATEAEVKAGDQIVFEKDTSGDTKKKPETENKKAPAPENKGG